MSDDRICTHRVLKRQCRICEVEAERDALIARNGSLAAELAYLRSERDALIMSRYAEFSGICAWCGEMQRYDSHEARKAGMAKHIARCDGHPVKATAERVLRLETAMSAAEDFLTHDREDGIDSALEILNEALRGNETVVKESLTTDE